MFTVHRNGTSAEELVQQHITIMNAAKALADAINAASPNMRDYYVQDAGQDTHRADTAELIGHYKNAQAIHAWAQERAIHAQRSAK